MIERAVRVFPDAKTLAHAAASEVATIATRAVAARGVCHIALSGGSTPRRLFEVLAEMGPTALPWDHVELWWGDERAVPPHHPDSNFGMAFATLIGPLGDAIHASHVHRIRAEQSPEVAARSYERELLGALGAPPVFDLVLLGLGHDGHTASLFPGSPAAAETSRWVIENSTVSTRITLTFPTLAEARHIRFLVQGADKATVLFRVLDTADSTLPAQQVAPRHGDLVWLVDAAAAGRLPTT